MDTMLVSVIILGYNGRGYLKDCLGSVLDQALPKSCYETLYVDNGSTDDSIPYVRSAFPCVKVIPLGINYGFAEGNNRAVDYATGKYIAFLNQDTVVHRRWLSELIRALESDQKIKACHSNMLMPWHSECLPRTELQALRYVYIADLTKFGYVGYRQVPFHSQYIPTLFVSGASLLIDRKILDYLDYVFDPLLFAYCEDTDLGLRLNSMGYETVLVPTSFLQHDQSRQNASALTTLRKARQITRNRFLVFFKNMYILEYLLFLPFLFLSVPLKIRELGLERYKQIAYILVSIPLALWSFAEALLEFPKYNDRRRRTLSRRNREKLWLLKRMLRSRM